MLANSLISHLIQPLKTSDTGLEALKLMNEHHCRHLPIVNNQQLLGLISEEDILTHPIDEQIGSYNLSLQKSYLEEDDHLYEAIRLIGENKLTLIPVIDADKNYVGCINQDDLLTFFANIGSFTEPGSIVVLQMNKRDYSLAEISRIVESEQAAILSTFITTNLHSEQVDVTIKINRNTIENIVAAFERFEYVIKASFQEEEYLNSLKDRYDALISYLNV